MPAMVGPEPHLSPALGHRLEVVGQWLDNITAASTNATLDLRNLRAVLIDLLEVVERDPTIDTAVDRLSKAAAACLEEVERDADRGRRPSGCAAPRRDRDDVFGAPNGLGESEAKAAVKTGAVVITGAQIRQARKLLGWEPYKLAQRAKVHSLIVQRSESVSGEPPITAYQEALIRDALQTAGVEFITGDAPGVKLRGVDAPRHHSARRTDAT